MKLDKFCEQMECDYYREWEYYDGEEQPYPCISCELQGQSYYIGDIAEDCPHRGKLLQLII